MPAILAMLLLGGLYLRYRDASAVTAFMKGVRPVVIALLAVVVWEFAPNALGLPRLGNGLLWLLAALAFVLAVRYGVHPAALIVAGGAIGLLAFR